MHLHNWVEVKRYFNECQDVSFEASMISYSDQARIIDEMNFGLTTVEQKCSRCGKIKAVTMRGDCT